MRTMSIRKLPIVFPISLDNSQIEQIISYYFEHTRNNHPQGAPIRDYSEQKSTFYEGLPVGKLFNIVSTDAMLYAEVGLIPLFDQFAAECPDFVIFISVLADLTKEPIDVYNIFFSLANRRIFYDYKITKLSEVKYED